MPVHSLTTAGPAESTTGNKLESFRILVVVKQKSNLWHSAWHNPEDTISTAIEALRKTIFLTNNDARSRLLAVHRWPHSIYLVFDIHHDSCDSSLGHLPEHNNLPVILVHLGRKISRKRASSDLQGRVNREVALAHNVNGEHGVPPFDEDHTSDIIPTYLNVRDPCLL